MQGEERGEGAVEVRVTMKCIHGMMAMYWVGAKGAKQKDKHRGSPSQVTRLTGLTAYQARVTPVPP